MLSPPGAQTPYCFGFCLGTGSRIFICIFDEYMITKQLVSFFVKPSLKSFRVDNT